MWVKQGGGGGMGRTDAFTGYGRPRTFKPTCLGYSAPGPRLEAKPSCPSWGQQTTDFPGNQRPSGLTLDVPALLPHLVHQPLCGGEESPASEGAVRATPAPLNASLAVPLSPEPGQLPLVRSSIISLTLGFSVVLFRGFLAGGGGA